MISKAKRNELFEYAKKVSKYSYSPYSKFAVGAAVLTKDNKILTGTNVENASYGLTICAERNAICNAISNGHKEIVAIAIYSEKREASPCGACRQFIIEFGKNIEIIYKRNGKLQSQYICNLMPDYFSKEELN